MKKMIVAGLVSSFAAASLLAQTVPNTVDAHVAAAKAAAGSEHTNTFNSLCMATEERASSNPAPRANATPPPPPDRAPWHGEPLKALHNLSHLGHSDAS